MRAAAVLTIILDLVMCVACSQAHASSVQCYQTNLKAGSIKGIDQPATLTVRWIGPDDVSVMAAVSEASGLNAPAKTEFQCFGDRVKEGYLCNVAENEINMFVNTENKKQLNLNIEGQFGLTREGDSTVDDLTLIPGGKGSKPVTLILNQVNQSSCDKLFAESESQDEVRPATQEDDTKANR